MTSVYYQPPEIIKEELYA